MSLVGRWRYGYTYMPWYSVAWHSGWEPHPRSVQHAKATCLAFPIILFFSLHRDSVWTACRRLERTYKVCTQSRHDIRREEYSLAFLTVYISYRAFSSTPLFGRTTWGQVFRQRKFTYFTSNLIAVFHGPTIIKIIGQLIMHRRRRGAGFFYSLRFLWGMCARVEMGLEL